MPRRRSPGLNSAPNVKMRRMSALERLLEKPEEERTDRQKYNISVLQFRIKNDSRVGYILRRKVKKKKQTTEVKKGEERSYDFYWGVFSVSTVRRSRSQRVTKSAGSGKKNGRKKRSKKKKEYALTLVSGELHNPAKKTARELRQKFYGKKYVVKAVRK